MLFLCIYSVVVILIVMGGLAMDKHKPVERICVAVLLLPVLTYPVLLALGITISEMLGSTLEVYSIILVILCIVSTIRKKRAALASRIAVSLFFMPIAILSVIGLLGV